MFCNQCGGAVTVHDSVCSQCGAHLPKPSTPPVRTGEIRAQDSGKTARRWAAVITIVIGTVFGVGWDILAAVVLFRSYSFFEAVVVSLLVMILCGVATVRADFEPWWSVLQGSDGGKPGVGKEPDVLEQLKSHLKALFYAIAFLMALVKLVLAVID